MNFEYQFCEESRSGAEEITLGSNPCGICSLVLEFDVLKRLYVMVIRWNRKKIFVLIFYFLSVPR